MFLFGLGKLVYVIILIINAIAVLSEDRFLARIGWGRTQAEPAFGSAHDSTSVKAKTINLIASVRTVMRSTYTPPAPFPVPPPTPIQAIFLGRAVPAPRDMLSRSRRGSSLANSPSNLVPLIVINTVIIVYELILG
ncbi:uncharacterized protein N7511_001994 [Penicillium nucicola]|uniref:uncharacterized protein n=1 Tax=Penicillium nucicola TaxID=1850975 RepID=UPI002544E3E3|nr:uncharacterized protein N7511_001994 [Penicillium nucicola]KAJ5769943.1 hypothetical protein N7511_001994 [Penicillium nucicola]